MHVADKAEILLIPAGLTNSAPPFFDSLEDLSLHPSRADRGSLGKAADELVEEFLGADLQVKGVAAVLDADVEKVQGEQGNVRVSVIYVVDDGDGGFAGGAALLAVDQVGNLEVQGEVRLVILGTACALYESLKLGLPGKSHLIPAVPGRGSSGSSLHLFVFVLVVVFVVFRMFIGG